MTYPTRSEKLLAVFNKDTTLVEATDAVATISSLDQDSRETVLVYVMEWFKAFIEGENDENDFRSEISKLDDKEAQDILMKFIRQKTAKMLEAAGFTAKSSDHQGSAVVASTTTAAAIKPEEQQISESVMSTGKVSIIDRIERKVNTSAGGLVKPSALNGNAFGGLKKQVKIAEKDESKKGKVATAGEGADDDESLLQSLTEEKKKQTRCRFYPACKNEETCPFVHPSEPCSFFPRCKFGTTCLNKHPECKFAKNCQRLDCFYEHPFPKKQGMNPLMQMLMMNGKRNMMMGGMGKPSFTKRPYQGGAPQSGAASASSEGDKTEQQQQQQTSEEKTSA